MSVITNYQLNIFGNFSIAPTSQNATDLMKTINSATNEDFLPSLISGHQVDVLTNKITNVSNLGFISQNQKYSISILNDRIDVIYNRNDDTNLLAKDFYRLAVNAICAIMENKNLQSYRLAVNVQAVADGFSESQIINAGKKIITKPNYYNDKPLIDWYTRINSECVIKLNDVDEKLNNIIEISAGKVAFSPKLALLYHIDINTLPQFKELRFNNRSVGEFVQNVIPIANQAIKDTEELISNEK